MARKKNIRPRELGIDLQSLREHELFRWFLACLLFGKPIQQEIARRAFWELNEAGLNSPEAVLTAGWNRLVRILDRAHYVRYDFSTASKLLEVCNAMKDCYGTVTEIIAQSATPAQLAKALQEFKGVGPVTAGIFVREIRPMWSMFKSDTKEQTREQMMNREPRRIPPKLLATTQKHRAAREVVSLPKASKKVFKKGGKGKITSVSPSQPHSKSFGR